MTIQYAKALIVLCIDEGLKQGVLKNRGEFEELLDYLEKYFIDTEKMTSGSSEIPKDLEEAAIQYAMHKKKSEEKEMETELPMGAYFLARDSFIAGAKWQKEQMMKEAVEGRIYDFRRIKEIGYSSAKIEFEEIPELDDGDNVRIIIVKED